MKRIRTEMKNSENNKQMASHYHTNKKTDQAPKRPKGAILQGQQQLQQTATHNTSNTKQENGFIKIGKF